MKKLVSAVAVGAVAVLACGAMVACGGDEEKTGVAYGMVHNAGYVGMASITVKGDKVLDADLNEICLPTQVTVTKSGKENVADADKVGDYFKTVSYGNVTFTYDADAKAYKTGDKTMVEFFQTEANAKAYYEAVVAGNVAVKLNNADDKTVMTETALSKKLNGYWDGASIHEGQLGWKVNREKTVEYVKKNGVKDILTLAKATTVTEKTDTENAKLGTTGNFVDANKVDTGATWTDMNTAKQNSFSYAQLFVKAAKAADFVKELNLVGSYSYLNEWTKNSFYGQSVIVTVENDKIKDVKLLDDPNLTELSAASGDKWTEEKRQNWTDNNSKVINALKGKTVSQVLALTVDTKMVGEGDSATKGEPLVKENNGGQTLDDAYILTGATQCSGRVVLAVQNALALLK